METFNVGDRVRYTGMNLTKGKSGVVIKDKHSSYSGFVYVQFDALKWWCLQGNLELIEKEESKVEVPKVYKALVEKGSGELVSIWVRGDYMPHGVELTYKEGQITYAPENSMGIFVEETLEEAVHNGRANSGSKVLEYNGTLVIREAVPLGDRLPKGSVGSFSGSTRYPAILLGEEVWREEPVAPPTPNPKFKVGDSVILPSGNTSGERIGEEFTISSVEWGDTGTGCLSYPRHKHYHYYADQKYFTPCDEDWLELVPSWVDVTEECVFKFENLEPKGFCGLLSHEGEWLIEFGFDKVRLRTGGEVGDYKVVESGKGHDLNYFRVLKRS